MRVLGIDPGLKLTGYACVEVDAVGDVKGEPRLVEAGVLRLKREAPLAFRLRQLYDDLADVLDETEPDHIFVEQLFSHYRHVRTAILMSHARGVVLLAGQQRSIDIGELMPTEIKKSTTGNGHATKRQIQMAVMSHFGLSQVPEPPDVADAIAIALCGSRRLATSRAEQ